MELYERLGVRPVINANATLTRLGGSLMPPEVFEAMHAASRHFVDLHELQVAVGARIAELTNNEAAYVTSGAAAGLYLSTLACALTTDPADGVSLLNAPRNEIIIHRSHYCAYAPSIELAGATLIWIDDERGATEEQLRHAIGARTAGVFYFAGAHFGTSALPLDRVIAIAHEAGLR